MRVLLLTGLFLVSFVTSVSAAPVEVNVEGTGKTRDEAVSQALVSAVEQVTGVAITAGTALRTQMAAVASADQVVVKLDQQTQSEVQRQSGGIVRSYSILGVSEVDGMRTAHLSVTIEVFKPKGLGNETRRRIAVAMFATSGNRPGPTADLLRDRIAAHLTQSRRFAVVDRSQDAAYAQEMQLLQSGNAPVTERARLGQIIGADYIVTGKLRGTAATRSNTVIGLTGEVVTSTTAGSAEADYQVIEIATRQIKWAGTARIPGGGAVDQVGAKIADEITQTIYPMRLIRFDDPANLIINQGGDSLHVGQRFRAMLMGEMMTDPYTHEPLGETEQEAGLIEIKRVDPKLSYALLVSGHLPPPGGSDVQIVLRPAAPAPVPHQRRATAAQDAPSVTKLPFDR
jgi:hypothetical protein